MFFHGAVRITGLCSNLMAYKVLPPGCPSLSYPP